MKRRTLLMAAGGVVTSGLLLPGTARAATVAIDPAASWGTWDGWGTSLAWWANVFGARDDLAGDGIHYDAARRALGLSERGGPGEKKDEQKGEQDSHKKGQPSA